jgi:hypothetical protein
MTFLDKADEAERQNTQEGARRVVNLALQGGGSHGAFAWGVLDRLLDEETLRLEGISGTSAGVPPTPSCSPMVLPPAVARELDKHYAGIGKECPISGLADHSNLP